MGKDKVTVQINDKKKKEISKALSNIITMAAQVERRRTELNSHLNNILEEKLEFTDTFGVTRTVVGRKNGDATYGFSDVFEVPEIKGHPFKEVSRNMAEHFKMYCLVNGVSDKDMLSMSYGEPAPELADVLRDLKKDFFLMVANKDMDAITDYYVGIANYIEKKLPDLMQCDDLRNIPKNEDNIILLNGKESFLTQTIQLGTRGSNESLTKEQQDLIQNVDNRLKDQGKKYSLLNVTQTISAFEFFSQSLLNVEDYEPPKSMEYEEIIDPEISDLELKPVQRACCLTKAVRMSKSDALSKGIDYNHTFPTYQTDIEVVDYGIKPADEALDYEIDKFSVNPIEQIEFAKDLSTRAAKLNSKKAPKPIVSLADSIVKIKLLEEKIKEDPASVKNNDYLQLGKLYESVAKASNDIISSDNQNYSDNQYLFAFDCKDFSGKGLQNPNIQEAKNKLKLMTDAMKDHMVAELHEMNKINSGVLALNDEFLKILREPFTHIDSKGVTRTFSGENNDPEKGTIGLKALFASPEYLGKPFLEVGRNMHSHFRMYCLTKGLTEDELLSMERSEVSPELHAKILGWKESFVDMVIEKDLDRISDMYVEICEMVNKDRDRFLSLRPASEESLQKNHALYLKYRGSQSWHAQSFNHGKRSETPESKEMIAKVNSKLAGKGYDFTFSDITVPLKTIESVQQMNKLASADHMLHTTREELDQSGSLMSIVNMIDGWPAYMRGKVEEFNRSNPDGNWLKAFPAEEKAIMEEALLAMGDKDATIERNISYNADYGIGKEPKQKGSGVKNDLSFAEIKKMLNKTITKSRRTLMRHPDNPDKKALVSFIAANEFLKNPSKFAGKNVKVFSDITAQIDLEAAVEAFGNLSKDEKKTVLSGSADSNEYIDFIDDYTYSAELKARKAEIAEAEEREEKLAKAEFYSRPAKEYYVNQQKELGNILKELSKPSPQKPAALPSDKIKDCLAKMIAAKQTQLLVKDKCFVLSEDQLNNATSKEAIENKASAFKHNPLFEDLANGLLHSQDLAKLSIGAEKLFDSNAIEMHGTSKESEKMISDVANYFTAIQEFSNVRKRWTSTRGQHDEIVTLECVTKMNSIYEKYKDFDCISILCAGGAANMYKKALEYVKLGSTCISQKNCEALAEVFKAGNEAKERLKAQGLKFSEKGIPENVKTGWNCTKSGFEAKQAKVNQNENASIVH